MNENRTGVGRRTSDQTHDAAAIPNKVSLADIESLLAEVKSHDITPEQLEQIKNAFDQHLSRQNDHRKKNSLTEIATVLSGGAAIGLAALALAPASTVIATVAAIAGTFVSWLAQEKIEQHNEEKARNEEAESSHRRVS
jgi:Spy/CpxP family protein refolding chaperone